MGVNRLETLAREQLAVALYESTARARAAGARDDGTGAYQHVRAYHRPPAFHELVPEVRAYWREQARRMELEAFEAALPKVPIWEGKPLDQLSDVDLEAAIGIARDVRAFATFGEQEAYALLLAERLRRRTKPGKNTT